MLLAGLALAASLLKWPGSAPATQPVAWRNYEEVFDLAVVGGRLLAVTNGGLLSHSGRDWVPIASPGGLRKVVSLHPFVVETAGGKRISINLPNAADSTQDRFAEHPPNEPAPDMTPGEPHFPHTYAVLSFDGQRYLGTAEGLYENYGSSMALQRLPTQLPVARPNGIVRVGDTYAVGGMGGLFLGRPGAWKSVASDAIRQVIAWENQFWVVHGNGAVDRIDLATDRIYADFLFGAAPRAWTSCIGVSGETLLFGGQGGWCERSKELRPQFPPELKSDVVLAIAGSGATRWIATEQSGVLRFSGKQVHRFNPGNGLADTWVTSLLKDPSGLWVGTMHAGLFMIAGDHVRPVRAPTLRVTALARIAGRLYVGGMDGAWVKEGSAWKTLPTHGEETTSISPVAGRPAVTTASGAYFF